MALKPEYGVMSGLAVSAVVFAVHQNATPTQADIQALPAGTPDIDRAERKATYISAGVVAGISLLAKDPTIFIIGSAATIAMALWTRNSNWTESIGGKYLSPSEASQAGSANTGPAPVETESYEMFQGSGNGFDR
jgi:hypothetical protein